MTLLLQGFHQQPLGPFNRDPLDWPVPTQPVGERVCPSDVVGVLSLLCYPTRSIEGA